MTGGSTSRPDSRRDGPAGTVEVFEPGVGNDRLLAGHADGLMIEQGDRAAGHEQPDTLRPLTRADLLLEVGEQRAEAASRGASSSPSASAAIRTTPSAVRRSSAGGRSPGRAVASHSASSSAVAAFPWARRRSTSWSRTLVITGSLPALSRSLP